MKMPDKKWMHIEGAIEIPASLDEEAFFQKFSELMEASGWLFAGFYKEEEHDD